MDYVAIIVPVYNVERYLKRCVESLLRQTYTALEIVLVDDCSSDSSPTLCDECKSMDNRIAVVHRTENGGLSAARNTGIDFVSKTAKSKWILFVDADDWISSRMVGTLVAGIGKNKANVGVCSYKRVTSTAVDENVAVGDFKALSPEMFLQSCSRIDGKGVYIQNIACAKLFLRECFDAVRFPEDIDAHEDVFTIYKIIFAQKIIAFSNAELYFYFINHEGITGRAWSKSRLNTVWGHQEQIDYFDKKNFQRALEIAVKQQMIRIPWAIEQSKNTPSLDDDILRMKGLLCENMRKYGNSFALTLVDFPAAWRILHPISAKFYILFILFKKGPKFFFHKITKSICIKEG